MRVRRRSNKKKGFSSKRVGYFPALLLFVAVFSLFAVSNEAIAGDLGLVLNGDFEVGSTGGLGTITSWNSWGGSGYHHNDYNHTISGSKAVKMWWDDSGIYQDFNVSGSTDYYFNAYFYNLSTDPLHIWKGYLKVEWYDSGYTKITENDIGLLYPDGTDPYNIWKNVSAKVTSPSNAVHGRPVFGVRDWTAAGPSGAVSLDDVYAGTSAPSGPTVGGTAYTDDTEATPIASAPVKVIVYDSSLSRTSSFTATTNGSGVYSVTLQSGELGDNDIICAYLNGSDKATSVYRCGGTSNVSTLNLYKNNVVVFNNDTTDMTNDDLYKVDDGNANILYSVSAASSGNLTVDSNIKLFLEGSSSKTFAPGGSVTLQGTGALKIESGATLSMASFALTVPDNLTNAGTITQTSSGTTTLTGTTKTITGGGSTTFYNLTVSGTYTLSTNIKASNTLTIDDNKYLSVNASSASVTVEVGGSIVNNGNAAGEGIVLADSTNSIIIKGSAGAKRALTNNNIDFNGKTVHLNNMDVQVATNLNAAGDTIVLDSACEFDDMTVNPGTLNNSGGYDLTVSGSWEVSGTGTFTPGTGTASVSLTGTAKNITTTSSNSCAFYNLAVSGSYTLQSSIGVAHNMTIGSTGTLDASNKTITLTGSAGNFDVEGTFTYGTSTVVIQATGDIQGAATGGTYKAGFYNLTIGKVSATPTVTVTAGGTWEGIQVYHTLTILSGATLTGIADRKVQMLNGSTVVNSGTCNPVEFEFNLGSSAGTATMGGGSYTGDHIQIVQGTVTLAGAVTASYEWRIGYWQSNSPAVLNLNGYNITSSGSIILGNHGYGDHVGQLTTGSGSITALNLFVNETVTSGGDHCSFTVGVGSTCTFSGAVLTHANGIITNNSSIICGNFTNESGGTYTANTAGCSISCADFTNDGTFTNSQTNTVSASGNVVVTAFGATTTKNTLTMTGDGKYINSSANLGNLVNNGGTTGSRNYIHTNNLVLDGTFTNNSGKYFTTLDDDAATSRNLTTGNGGVNGTIAISGPFYANASTITIKDATTGNFDVNVQANFQWGTSLVDLKGTGSIIGHSHYITFNSLTCGYAGKTTSINMGADWMGFDIHGTLTVGTGVLQQSVANQKIFVYGATIVNSGTIYVTELWFDLTAPTIMNGGDLSTTQIFIANGATLTLTGNVTHSGNWQTGHQGQNTTNVLNVNQYNIVSSGWFDAGEWNLTDFACVGQVNVTTGNITVGLEMHIYPRINGSDVSSINLGSGTHNIGSELGIVTSGTVPESTANALLTLSSATTTVGGNFKNLGTSAQVIANGGTLIFNDNTKTSTIYGSSSFYNLTCATAGKTLLFNVETGLSNYITTVTHNLNFSGSSGLGNKVTLGRSDGSGSQQWAIYPAGSKSASPGWTVAYVDVSNSVNLNSNYINPDNSNDGGNNTNWFSPTLVRLTAFYAIGYFDKVGVYWKTASEYNNAGFNVYVSENPGGPYKKLNPALIAGLGTSTTGGEYSFTDTGIINKKTYYYKLEDVELSGRSKMHGPVAAHPGLDSDGDGMTDDWETYYGLDPHNPNDALLDPDGDGRTNLEEFAEGTDPTQKEEQAQEGVRIISSDETGITLELVTSEFKATPKKIGGVTYQVLKIPGYEHGYTGEPGKPQMPLKPVLLGIPQDVSCAIADLDIDVTELSGYNIYPVRSSRLVDDLRKTMAGKEDLKAEKPVFKKIESHLVIDEKFYSTDTYYPADIVSLGFVGDMRGQRTACVDISPLVFNPAQHSLKFYKRIKFKLQFKSAEAGPPIGPPPSSPSLDAKIKIYTTKEGLCRIGWDALWNAKFYDAIWLDPRKIRLYNKGQEVAIRIAGEEDGRFNSDDYIEFYAQANNSKYSTENVYWLTYAQGKGLRMENIPSSPGVPVAVPDRYRAKVHLEKNDFYWGEREGPEDIDRWLWNSYIWGGTEVNYPIGLKDVNLLHPGDEARVKIAYYALFDVDHHTLSRLNGGIVDDASWTGQCEHVAEVSVPQSVLVEGGNTITLAAQLAPGAEYDLLVPDYFEVEYWRNFVAADNILDFSYRPVSGGVTEFNISGFTKDNVELFDITEPAKARYVTGSETVFQPSGSYSLVFKYDFKPDEGKRFLALASDKADPAGRLKIYAPSGLSSPENKADYIMISYGAFKDNLYPLKRLYERKGLNVSVVDVEDVYDEFNYGLMSPYAIKDFLRYTYNTWQRPAPTYVLLVGGANYDYRDYLGSGKINYVPAYLLPNTPYLGETASDNWFVCLDPPQLIGGQVQDDILPDMFIGRIPASGKDEVDNVVKKIIDYSSLPYRYQSKKVTFAADDEAIFEQTSDNLVQYLPGNMIPSKLYLSGYTDYSRFTQDLINDINSGTVLLNYAGHGSTNLWTGEGLFNTGTVGLLNNYRKYPFVVSFDCLDGYFLGPDEGSESLAEVFLNKRDAGAIACFSPTGMGMPEGQQALGEELFKSIFVDGNYRLGPATTRAKINFYSRMGGQYKDLIETQTLFGDPALSLKTGVKEEKKWRKKLLGRQPLTVSSDDDFKDILQQLMQNAKDSGKWGSGFKRSRRPED